VERDGFITQEAFEALSEEWQAGYVTAFMPSFRRVVDSDGAHALKLDFIQHYYDLMEWLLPPEEYDKLVKTPMWNAAFENAELMLDALEEGLASPDVPDSGKAGLPAMIQAVKAMIQHKRDLDELPEQP